MAEIDLNTPIYFQINFEDDESFEADFRTVLQSEDFKELVKTQVYPRIKHAIHSNLDEFPLFRFYEYETDFAVVKKQYGNLLKHIQQLYVEEEDYDSCEEIQILLRSL